MDIDPTIRTPREDARAIYREDTRSWQERYDAYLRSPTWRRKRDGALRRARWTCERCPAQRGLQVHHKTYERLGTERDSDLEVLCPTCHEGHHIDEHQQVHGIYVKVVSELLKVETFTCMADLMEAAKQACARNKIQYDGRKIWRAVSLIDANRHGILDAPKPKIKPVKDFTPQEFQRPVTKAEALDFCRTIGWNLAPRSMPGLEKDDYYRDMERANAIRRQAAELTK